MDRRSEVRLPVNQAVRLTVLGESSGAAGPLEAMILNLSRTGFLLSSPDPVAPDTPVRVDLPLDGKKALLLGEVRYCQPDSGRFHLGVSLEHSILDLTGLDRLRAMIAGAERASEPLGVEAA